MSKSEEKTDVYNIENASGEEEHGLSAYVPERYRKPGEIGFAIIATVFGVLGYYFALGMTSDSYSAPSVFPKLASVIIIACGVICIFKACRKDAPEPGSPNVFRYLFPRDVIVILLMLLAYCVLLPKLHFIVSSYLFMAGGMVYLHRGKYIWQSMLISAGAMVVLVAIFRYVFLVILP
jgi:hypothetical protein